MRAQQGGDEVVMFGDSLMEAFRGTKFGSPAKLYQDYPNLLKVPLPLLRSLFRVNNNPSMITGLEYTAYR